MRPSRNGVVVDDSVAIKWFVEEPGSDASQVLLQLFGEQDALVAPGLLWLEVVAVLGKRARTGRVTPEYPRVALQLLRRIPIRIVPDAELLDHAVLLSEVVRHPVYDCLYLALACRLDANLATFDKGLAALALQEDRLWPMT